MGGSGREEGSGVGGGVGPLRALGARRRVMDSEGVLVGGEEWIGVELED